MALVVLLRVLLALVVVGVMRPEGLALPLLVTSRA
jgi:hypothetical protein